MLKNLLLSISLLLLSQHSQAQCDFKTGQFAEELSNPIFVKAIDIQIPKSAKWEKNFLKIVHSKNLNIPPSLKKSFFANIVVTYSFGKCIYEGEVKQNGDWKDHVNLIGGKPIRSVNIKLKSGNILNSIKFKLLIPETRNDLKEVFAVSLLSALDFIVPETFKVLVNLNGTKTEMLFQEAARKELLERNNRREGPIFEGDETLLWGEGDGLLNNKDISLSRLVNSNWFLKGTNSASISLSSYQILQKAYMVRANNIQTSGSYLDPNIFLYPYTPEDLTFPKFHFIMQSLGAEHGLNPHNRIFYFNSFQNSFEPIYYDGDIWELNNTSFSQNIIERSYKDLNTVDYGLFISSSKIKESAHKKFKQRVNLNNKESEYLFQKYWDRFITNIDRLNLAILKTEVFHKDLLLTNDGYIKFLKRASQNPMTDLLSTDIQISKDKKYIVDFLDASKTSLTHNEVSKMISKNLYDKRRATLTTNEKLLKDITILRQPFLGGTLVTKEGVGIEIDKINQKLILQQTNASDWALLINAAIDNWSIELRGDNLGISKQDQRFNDYGMTGCLNIHSSNFHETVIFVTNGGCEDSLNIVNSTGTLKKVTVSSAHADALDLDYSSLKLAKIDINKAGNDCIDVSGGNYIIGEANLNSCGDKGISVGEASNLNASTLILKKAIIGVSSKDLSKVQILNADIIESSVCTEVMQKKQEFGGAYLNITQLNCSGINNIDTNSIFFSNNK